MLPIAFTISLVLLVITGMGCLVLNNQRRRTVLDRDNYKLDLEKAREAAAGLEKDLAVLRETTAHNERRFAELRDQAQQAFRSLAGDALRESSQQFLQLAEQRLKVEQARAGEQLDARHKAIEQLVQPVKETLEKYNVTLQQIEKVRQGAYESLTRDLEIFRADQRRLREETGNLVKALRRPEVRGRWGEVQLRRVVELAGMVEHCDFQEQMTVGGGDEGRLRPDMVVQLPTGRTIVIDAKTPIDAFLDSIDCPDDATRDQHLRRHADQIESKVRDLAGKGYQQQFERSPDFVVLFIPGESFLQPALQMRPMLMESAMERGVVIATPTTLISLLRAVALGWREERLAENAEKISREAVVLHERLVTLAGYMEKVGGSLGKAVEHYNDFIRSLDSRLMPSVRKLESMQVQSSKPVPELAAIDSRPVPSISFPSPSEAVNDA